MTIYGMEQYMAHVEQHFGLKKEAGTDYIRYTLPQQMGNGFFELFDTGEQFQVWITHAELNQDVSLSYAQNDNTYIGLSYIETDARRENAAADKASNTLQALRTSRSLPSDDVVQGICKANMPLHAVNILIYQDFFCRYVSKTHTASYFDIIKMLQSFDEQTFMHGLYPILAGMLHCPYKNTARSLFMKSRVYETAAHLISLCDDECAQPVISLSTFDARQIRKVPDILREHMENPPSISSLSRMVALNEFKLKAGFKQVFNTTIYEHLRQLRTDEAMELMKEDWTLEQIAEKVGYKSLRGFTQAFTKCTGKTPAEWRRQRV